MSFCEQGSRTCWWLFRLMLLPLILSSCLPPSPVSPTQKNKDLQNKWKCGNTEVVFHLIKQSFVITFLSQVLKDHWSEVEREGMALKHEYRFWVWLALPNHFYSYIDIFSSSGSKYSLTFMQLSISAQQLNQWQKMMCVCVCASHFRLSVVFIKRFCPSPLSHRQCWQKGNIIYHRFLILASYMKPTDCQIIAMTPNGTERKVMPQRSLKA